jgi:DNA polymerase (family 10)
VGRPNDAVADLLQEYADLISITGGDAFKARVYERAARAVAGHPMDVSTLDVKGLLQIPNVGKSTAEKIAEYLASGQVRAIEELRAKIPAGVLALTRIPTLGPKKALVLYEELGVASVEELRDAILAGKLEGRRGFGAKTAENLLHGIAQLDQGGGRFLVSVAMAAAEEVVAELSAVTGCRRCTYAGSLRRMRETIGDVDILVAATDSEPIMATFARLPAVAEVIARGPKKTSVRTARGMQVDLRVVPPEAWGAALQYFTGAKAHNIRTREIAVRKGLKLSEYGLFRVDDGTLVVSETEEEVYERLGLPWVPPTLREDRGEIEAALAGQLPELVTEQDIRGDLHTHTNLTDGVSTLEDMVAAGQARGYEYYAVTDHAKDMPMQRMTDEKMLAQREKLRALARGKRMKLLHGTELNIDPDGNVDWGPEFLAGFDICVASVHSHFNQSSAAMTQRLVRACENPYVNVIGHLTTRKIGKRPPVEADFDAVFAAAARTGTALEVNSYPDRLDLNDELVLRAKRHGVKFAIDTDSHATVHLDHLRYGIGIAQRGWLTPDDVVNTWPLARLREFVRAKRKLR